MRPVESVTVRACSSTATWVDRAEVLILVVLSDLLILDELAGSVLMKLLTMRVPRWQRGGGGDRGVWRFGDVEADGVTVFIDVEDNAVFYFSGVRAGVVGDFDVKAVGLGEAIDLYGLNLLSGKAL